MDDLKGNLTITGWLEGEETAGSYAENEEGGFNIQHVQPSDSEAIVGTVEDEHNIGWSDGTHWEEIKPDGAHWSHYVGAATAGAAASGAAGYLMQKKFFKKASNGAPSDYVIVLDRSKVMSIPDAGK